MSLPPMGWYPDPAGSPQERYWDGSAWTHNLRDAQPGTGLGGRHDGDGTRESRATRQHQDPGAASAGADPRAQHQPPQFQGYGPSSQTPASPQFPYGAGQVGSSPVSQQFSQQALSAAAATGAVAGRPVHLTGWWRRLGGYLIDSLLLGVIGSLVLRGPYDDFVGAYTNALQTWMPHPDSMSSLWTILVRYGVPHLYLIYAGLATLINVAYSTVMLALRGQTLGQMAVGIRVVPAGRAEVTHLGWLQALVRSLVWWISVGVLSFLPGLVPLTNDRRQGLHDLAARTQVVDAR